MCKLIRSSGESANSIEVKRGASLRPDLYKLPLLAMSPIHVLLPLLPHETVSRIFYISVTAMQRSLCS